MTNSQIRPGRKLRIARVTADLLQSELAERAGIHQTHISLLERGKRGTSRETLSLIAAALGCDVTDLIPDEAAA
jgi:transcriptional regulator with XRE-family HTH domain